MAFDLSTIPDAPKEDPDPGLAVPPMTSGFDLSSIPDARPSEPVIAPDKSYTKDMFNQAWEVAKDIGNVYPVAETAANLITTAYGFPISGLAGIASMPFTTLFHGDMEKGIASSDKFMKTLQDYLIYKPSGESSFNQLANYPFTEWEKGADFVSKKFSDSPATEALVYGAIMALPAAAGLKDVPAKIVQSMRESTAWRQLTIKERGLVVQSLTETLKNNPDMNMADLIRNSKNYYEEARLRDMADAESLRQKQASMPFMDEVAKAEAEAKVAPVEEAPAPTPTPEPVLPGVQAALDRAGQLAGVQPVHPPEVQAAVTNVINELAPKLGVQLENVELVDQQIVIDPSTPEGLQRAREIGIEEEEIQNAIESGEKYQIFGQHELLGSEGGQRRSAIKIFQGATIEDVYHEFAHAVERQGGLPGWVGTPEQHAEYLSGEIAKGRASVYPELTEESSRVGTTSSTAPAGEVLHQVDAWHGSPYKFDAISHEKIGTGEGAQAFGYGSYYTGKQGLEKHYADMINTESLKAQHGEAYIPVYKYKRGDKLGALEYIDESIKDAEKGIEKWGVLGKEKEHIDHLKAIRKQIEDESIPKGGFSYKAQLFPGKDPSEYTFLDWYEPVDSKTIKSIVDKSSEVGIDFSGELSKTEQAHGILLKKAKEEGRYKGITGNNVYQMLSKQLGSDKEASAFLKRAGIDGIRYPTETLSGKGAKGGGAYNYVVFDDKDVRLVSRESGGKVEVLSKPESNVTKDSIDYSIRIFSEDVEVDYPPIAKAMLDGKPVTPQMIEGWKKAAKAAGVSAKGIKVATDKFKNHNAINRDGPEMVLPWVTPHRVVIRKGVLNTPAVEGVRRERLDKVYEGVYAGEKSVEVGPLFEGGQERTDIPGEMRGLEPNVFLNVPITQGRLQRFKPPGLDYPLVVTGNSHVTNFKRPHKSWDSSIKAVRVKPVAHGNAQVTTAVVNAINYAKEIGAKVLITAFRAKQPWVLAKFTDIVPTDPTNPEFAKYWVENPNPKSTEPKKFADWTPYVPKGDAVSKAFREAGWDIEKNIYGTGGTWWWPTTRALDPAVLRAIGDTPVEYCDLMHKGCPSCRNCQKLTYPEAAGAPIVGVTDEPFCEHGCPQCFVRLGQSGIKGRKGISIGQNAKQGGFGESDLGDQFKDTITIMQGVVRPAASGKVDYVAKFLAASPAEKMDKAISLYLDGEITPVQFEKVRGEIADAYGDIIDQIAVPDKDYSVRRVKGEEKKKAVTPKATPPHVEKVFDEAIAKHTAPTEPPGAPELMKESEIAAELDALEKEAGRTVPRKSTKMIASIRKETGQVPVRDIVSVSAKQALKDQIKLEAKAAREAYRAGKLDESIAAKERQYVAAIRLRMQKEERAATKQMLKQLKAIDTSKMSPANAAPIENLLENLDLTRHTSKTLLKLEGLRNFLENNPEAELPDDMFDRLKILDQRRIQDLSFYDLEDLHMAVMHYVHLEKTKKRIKVGQKLRKAERVLGAAISEMKPAQQIVDDIVSSQGGKKSSRSVGKLLKDTFGIRHDHYDLIVETLAGPNSTMDKVLYQGVKEGIIEQYRHRQVTFKKFTDAIKPILEKVGKDVEAWMSEEVQVGKYKLSRNERMALYRHSLNDDNRAAILKGGFGFKASPTPNLVYNITKEDLNEILESLTPEEIAFATGPVDQLFNDQRAALDKVFYEKNGYPMPKVENYYPKEVMPLSRGTDFEKESALDAFKGKFVRVGVSKGMLKERLGSKKPIYLNSLSYDLNKSVMRSAAYIGLELPMTNASKLLYDPTFRLEMSNRYGEVVWQQIEEALQDIVGDYKGYTSVEQLILKAKNNLAVAVLGLNPFVMANQILSIPTYGVYVDNKFLIQGMMELWTNHKEIMARHYQYSPEFFERVEGGFTRDVRDVFRAHFDKRLVGASTNLKEKSMAGIKFFDAEAVASGMQGAVLQVLDEFKNGKLSNKVQVALNITDADIPNLTPEDKMRLAYKYADFATERTQDMFSPEHRSSLTRGSPFEQLFTMFGSFTNQALNMIRRSHRQYQRAKTSEEKSAAMKGIASTLFLLLVVNPIGQMAVDRIRDAIYGREHYGSLLGDWIRNVASYMFFVRDIVNSSVSKIEQGTFAGRDVEVPALRVVNLATDTIGEGGKFMTETNKKKQAEAGAKFINSALEMTLMLNGIPYATPKRFAESLIEKPKPKKKHNR